MKKRIIFILIAVLAVSFTSSSYAGLKKIKKNVKDAVTNDSKKKDKKDKKALADEKKIAPVSGNVVLAKGLQISWCGRDVKDNGSVTIPGLQDLTLPVKNGKFDLTLPASPVFGDEWGLNQQSGFAELDFGDAKVNQFVIIYFENSNTNGSREETAGGRGGLDFRIFYSDKDVTGTINGEAVTLKKGWNIVGDKKAVTASLMCTG
jgi:hypothetical protein